MKSNATCDERRTKKGPLGFGSTGNYYSKS